MQKGTELFLKRARELEMKARQTSEKGAREAYGRMARSYRLLASRIEGGEFGKTHAPKDLN